MGLFSFFSKKDPNPRTNAVILRQKIQELQDIGLTEGEIAEELNVNPKRVHSIIGNNAKRTRKNSDMGTFFTQLREYERYRSELKMELRKEVEEEEDNSGSDYSGLIVQALLGGMNNARSSTGITGALDKVGKQAGRTTKPK